MKRKNKSTPNNEFLVNRQNLINKISDAISLKYSNFFSIAKYDIKTLKEDVGRLLSTQYYSKEPKEVFRPIELNILDIVKKKYPNLQIKVRKARKLPQIKYPKNKYDEADELEKENENKYKSLIPRKKIVKSQNKILTKKSSNKAIDKNQIIKTISTNKQMSQTDVNAEIDKEERSNTLYRLKEEYGTRHTLVDQLKYKIKHDPTIQYLIEEQKLYEKEQEEKKQKKILEQNKYLNDLKSQIEERNKIKEQEKKIELKEFEEIQKHIISEKEKEKQKKIDELLKREKLKKNYEKLIQEKDIIKRRQKLQAEKEDKLLSEQINEEINNEKKNNLEKKNKMKEEILKIQEINEKLAREKMNNEKQDNKIEGNLFKQNTLSTNAVRERINKRLMGQQIAGNYLLKIYNTLEKQDQNAYIAEREKQEQKKKLEYELADRTRKMKLDDFKKSLQDTLAIKNLEKEKKKEEEAKYRQKLEEEYALYLNEEKEKKLKKFEKYENYRKALEEQIKENKIREIENFKY